MGKSKSNSSPATASETTPPYTESKENEQKTRKKKSHRANGTPSPAAPPPSHAAIPAANSNINTNAESKLHASPPISPHKVAASSSAPASSSLSTSSSALHPTAWNSFKRGLSLLSLCTATVAVLSSCLLLTYFSAMFCSLLSFFFSNFQSFPSSSLLFRDSTLFFGVFLFETFFQCLFSYLFSYVLAMVAAYLSARVGFIGSQQISVPSLSTAKTSANLFLLIMLIAQTMRISLLASGKSGAWLCMSFADGLDLSFMPLANFLVVLQLTGVSLFLWSSYLGADSYCSGLLVDIFHIRSRYAAYCAKQMKSTSKKGQVQ